MLEGLIGFADLDAGLPLAGFLSTAKNYFLIFVGFSLVIFFHELGHFIAAKSCNVRVDRFAIGFGRELFGFVRGETRYSFNMLPLGGYVKMLGQEDFAVDKSGEWMVKDDPRAFTHQSVGRRMVIVSSGVVMNLVFAAAVFMLVFMIGVDFPPAKIGLIQPDSPAERAGMRLGDRIVEVNGKDVADYGDLRPAVMLSDPDESLVVTVERPDPEGGPASREVIKLTPEKDLDDNILRIGIAPPMNNTVAYLWEDPRLPPEEQLKPGDKIVEVNGQPVSSLYEIYPALIRGKGQWADLTVRRPVGANATEFKELHLKRRAKLAFRSTGDAHRDGGHLLGLVPRRIVSAISPGGRADLAGVKSGDVLVRWGPHYAPTMAEILDTTKDSPEIDIRVTVLRRSLAGVWETVSLYVRPKPSGVFGTGRAKVGLDPFSQEQDHLVVADIVTNVTDDIQTPAAHLKGKMLRGSLITKLNDQPVATWSELTERFIELAGSEVKLTWRYQDQPEQSATIHVPRTLGTSFSLPPGYVISSIDGQRRVEVVKDGKAVTLPAAHWLGASEILKKCIGRTVEVEYREILGGGPSRTAQVDVTPEMLDTWVTRVAYDAYDLVTLMDMEKTRESNPAKAMMIGVRKTYQFIEQIYLIVRRMVITRSVGLEQISGPVGIVQMGSEVAREDFAKLLFFLAMISANLAVINFLPLPIMDGGLFVFLIVEKIKGSPISIRVQIATQLIGLALIIGIFLFVTIQDIHKIMG